MEGRNEGWKDMKEGCEGRKETEGRKEELIEGRKDFKDGRKGVKEFVQILSVIKCNRYEIVV